MLRRYSQILITVLLLVDLALTFASGMIAYWLRYLPAAQGWLPVRGEVPAIGEYVRLTLLALPLAAISYRAAGLYTPRRVSSLARELFDVSRATAGLLVALITINFFLKGLDTSRAVITIFFVCNVAALWLSRSIARSVLRRARARGWNQRYVLIVGSGRLGQKLAEKFAQNPWTGFRVVGYVDPRSERKGLNLHGVPVLGGIEDLQRLAEEEHVDQIFIALAHSQQDRVPELLDVLAELHTDVRVVPDTLSFVTLNKSIDDFAGMPIINLRESPLYGWNRVAKRCLDISMSAILLLLFLPVMIAIAIAVRLGSRGPIFYRQERMGLDGRLFQMIKFRTMRVDAEKESGAVWAKQDDPRRTRLGTWLRKTSLDELPQFWNVLVGDMSLVGPRPERPVFIEEFKRTIPRYMLRHRVKAGLTGWAQVNGWRGNTSLRKRIQYDLDYIENCSLLFDLRIIFLTVFRGFLSPNAY